LYTRHLAASLAAVALALSSCNRQAAEAPPQIVVGAAANLTDAGQKLGAAFESETGVKVMFSFASTAQLTSQIQNGAPYDVFLSADAQHADQLNQQSLLVAGSDQQYALGVLALWIPDPMSPVQKIEDLSNPAVHNIAIAKPELAPYGEAAVEALKHTGVWDRIGSKIVYAENISMAKQFGTSKNADAVFTAYSLVLNESGRVIQVDQNLYSPIVQKLGVLSSSRNKSDAQKFVAFVLKGKGHAILANLGYR
jgi:molybdate transport system substrate-binding protein